jgi:hypothetical protein
MIKRIGKFHVEYPIWFLADSLANHALGIRGRTGFLVLPIFTDKELAQRFADQQNLKNAVIMSIENVQRLSDLLRNSSESFAHLTFDPVTNQPHPWTGSSVSLEGFLTALSEES